MIEVHIITAMKTVVHLTNFHADSDLMRFEIKEQGMCGWRDERDFLKRGIDMAYGQIGQEA